MGLIHASCHSRLGSSQINITSCSPHRTHSLRISHFISPPNFLPCNQCSLALMDGNHIVSILAFTSSGCMALSVQEPSQIARGPYLYTHRKLNSLRTAYPPSSRDSVLSNSPETVRRPWWTSIETSCDFSPGNSKVAVMVFASLFSWRSIQNEGRVPAGHQ